MKLSALGLLAMLAVVACSSPESRPPERLDLPSLVQQAKGARTRVLVIPSDGDDEQTIVAQVQRWNRAGTMHVVPLAKDHPEAAVGFLRLADIVQLAGDGPHSVMNNPALRDALSAARQRGALILE